MDENGVIMIGNTELFSAILNEEHETIRALFNNQTLKDDLRSRDEDMIHWQNPSGLYSVYATISGKYAEREQVMHYNHALLMTAIHLNDADMLNALLSYEGIFSGKNLRENHYFYFREAALKGHLDCCYQLLSFEDVKMELIKDVPYLFGSLSKIDSVSVFRVIQYLLQFIEVQNAISKSDRYPEFLKNILDFMNNNPSLLPADERSGLTKLDKQNLDKLTSRYQYSNLNDYDLVQMLKVPSNLNRLHKLFEVKRDLVVSPACSSSTPAQVYTPSLLKRLTRWCASSEQVTDPKRPRM